MKKNLISIVILALLIVNIVLTAIMMFSVMSTNKKTAALVSDVAAAISLDLGIGTGEEEVKEAVPMENTVPYTIADMNIALQPGEDGKSHYVQLSVTMSMNSKHDDYATYSDLSTREDLIKGQIREVVSQYSMENAKANEQAIKAEILNRIQTLFGSDFIFDVTLSNALYQ